MRNYNLTSSDLCEAVHLPGSWRFKELQQKYEADGQFDAFVTDGVTRVIGVQHARNRIFLSILKGVHRTNASKVSAHVKAILERHLLGGIQDTIQPTPQEGPTISADGSIIGAGANGNEYNGNFSTDFFQNEGRAEHSGIGRDGSFRVGSTN